MPLTDTQDAFISNLELTNTDHRAVSAVKAAFKMRNRYVTRPGVRLSEEVRDFIEAIDKAAS